MTNISSLSVRAGVAAAWLLFPALVASFTATTTPGTNNANLLSLGTLEIHPVAVGSVKIHKNPEKAAAILHQLPPHTLIDTAEKYGEGVAETILGQAMAQTNKKWGQDLYCATKYTPSLWRRSPSNVVDACRASIKRLGCDAIDLYQIHFASSMLQHIVPFGNLLPKAVLEEDEFLWEGMVECYQEGLIKNVGVCNYGPTMTRRAFEYFQSHNVPLVSNQVNFNLMRAGSTQPTVRVCDELGIQVLGYQTLGKGCLTGAFDDKDTKKVAAAKGEYSKFRFLRTLTATTELRKVLSHMADTTTGSTQSQIAVQWVVQKGRVPIVGVRSAERAKEIAGSLELTKEQMEALDQAAAKCERTGQTYMGKEFVLN